MLVYYLLINLYNTRLYYIYKLTLYVYNFLVNTIPYMR